LLNEVSDLTSKTTTLMSQYWSKARDSIGSVGAESVPLGNSSLNSSGGFNSNSGSGSGGYNSPATPTDVRRSISNSSLSNDDELRSSKDDKDHKSRKSRDKEGRERDRERSHRDKSSKDKDKSEKSEKKTITDSWDNWEDPVSTNNSSPPAPESNSPPAVSKNGNSNNNNNNNTKKNNIIDLDDGWDTWTTDTSPIQVHNGTKQEIASSKQDIASYPELDDLGKKETVTIKATQDADEWVWKEEEEEDSSKKRGKGTTKSNNEDTGIKRSAQKKAVTTTKYDGWDDWN